MRTDPYPKISTIGRPKMTAAAVQSNGALCMHTWMKMFYYPFPSIENWKHAFRDVSSDVLQCNVWICKAHHFRVPVCFKWWDISPLSRGHGLLLGNCRVIVSDTLATIQAFFIQFDVHVCEYETCRLTTPTFGQWILGMSSTPPLLPPRSPSEIQWRIFVTMAPVRIGEGRGRQRGRE